MAKCNDFLSNSPSTDICYGQPSWTSFLVVSTLFQNKYLLANICVELRKNTCNSLNWSYQWTSSDWVEGFYYVKPVQTKSPVLDILKHQLHWTWNALWYPFLYQIHLFADLSYIQTRVYRLALMLHCCNACVGWSNSW